MDENEMLKRKGRSGLGGWLAGWLRDIRGRYCMGDLQYLTHELDHRVHSVCDKRLGEHETLYLLRHLEKPDKSQG